MGVFSNSNLNAIGAADFKHPHLDKKGNLKPYFSTHDIIISKDKLDKIWK